MAKTVNEILQRLCYEHNQTYDAWKRRGESGSLTADLVPILNDAAVDLLRTVGLTLLPPQDLKLAISHTKAIITHDLLSGPGGPVEYANLNWDATMAHMRRLR